jgi:hypothetical protein
MSIRTDLPASFPAAASAGLIGVATTPGAYSFTLKVTSGSQSATQTASMHISGLLLKDPYQFPDAFANVTFTPHQLTPLNNAGPVNYALNSGTLPPGMTMSASGLISGTPTTPGNYNWGSASPTGWTPNTAAFTSRSTPSPSRHRGSCPTQSRTGLTM